jgi:hypothetical protein
MPVRGKALPRSGRVYEQRLAAERRYVSYEREVADLLMEARSRSNAGNWSEAANTLQAVVSTASAMAGTAHELNLLYLITED